MTTPHLLPAATAVLLLAAAVGAGYCYARRVERRSIHALATAVVPDLAQRRAWQLEAFRHRDLLPVYGSSELLIDDPHHATHLFQDYPTGFTVVPVGQKAGCAVLHVQHLGALGTALRGKKVVLSFTANSFFERTIGADTYAGNFSRGNANELAFSPCLSYPVKRTVARRMLGYPKTLEQDPLLAFALRQLADDSWRGKALYYAALPLGRLQVGVLRLQDHLDVFGFVRSRHLTADGRPARPGPAPGVDWSGYAARGATLHHRHCRSNPYGFEDNVWRKRFRGRDRQGLNPQRDARLRRALEGAPEWDDLDTLLRALHELGAEPLIVITPLKGCFLGHTCLAATTRLAYYERIQAVAHAHGVPLVDFADHDLDPDFLFDASHLSPKGWVYYDYTLDAFFHNRRELVFRPGAAYPRDDPSQGVTTQALGK